jgi:hypothetical protein
MLFLLIIWLAVGIALAVLASQRRESAGLTLAYFLGISLIHVPGAILYLDGNEMASTSFATIIGFEQTIIGLVAFLSGVVLAKYAFRVNAERPQHIKQSQYALARTDGLARVYLWVGAVVYFVVLSLISGIASLTAIFAPLGSLIVVGACLRFWVANKEGNWLKFWFAVALLPLLPLATLIQGGFIGFGTYWVLAIVAFLFVQSKHKVRYILFAPVAFFVGLSVFVNYMGARNDIRHLVWHEQASVGDRLQRIADIFQNFEWLDLSNWQHREAIDGRLNQNFLVGMAVERLETGQVKYASGATLGTVIIALVPRALWPDKPVVGGGGTVVHDFTGIEFAEGTSVGAGQVFEFYVNFGTLGVIGGFFLYGLLLGRLDLLAKMYLDKGDQRHFLFFFLIGLALLQPGGNLLEIVVTAVASGIVAYGIGLLVRLGDRSRSAPLPQMMTSRGWSDFR